MRARVVMLAGLLVLAGCGGSGPAPRKSPPPVLGQRGDQPQQGPPLAYPVLATRNTTRVPGGDPIADAAAVARAVYPELKPKAVALVDSGDWRAGMAAAELAGRAPILLAQGGGLPPATKSALTALAPTGLAAKAGGAQVVRVGTQAAVTGFKTRDLSGASPAALSAAVDRLEISLAGKPSGTVVVASPDHPDYAMPAAGWAAKAGAPVLWTAGGSLPAPTVAAIRRHKRPRILVLGPAAVVPDAVLRQLRKLGSVTRVGGRDPVTSAIEFARLPAGWNVRDPGHGLVFASTRRPLDAAAGAPLSASGTYGPLLVVTDANALPSALQSYLLDIEPGYDTDPVRGVYNHGWLLGDESAIAEPVQARIDTLLEIEPVQNKGD